MTAIEYSNRYTLQYSIIHETGEEPPKHLKHTFESQSDLLGALDEGACAIWDAYKAREGGETFWNVHELILRSITHENAREWAETIINQAKERAK